MVAQLQLVSQLKPVLEGRWAVPAAVFQLRLRRAQRLRQYLKRQQRRGVGQHLAAGGGKASVSVPVVAAAVAGGESVTV